MAPRLQWHIKWQRFRPESSNQSLEKPRHTKKCSNFFQIVKNLTVKPVGISVSSDIESLLKNVQVAEIFNHIEHCYHMLCLI